MKDKFTAGLVHLEPRLSETVFVTVFHMSPSPPIGIKLRSAEIVLEQDSRLGLVIDEPEKAGDQNAKGGDCTDNRRHSETLAVRPGATDRFALLKKLEFFQHGLS
ncbi:MAG: hypothetical protein KJ070_25965, partial [Verrucomicrobia bacterium]|nr:hypothetical protein [Verrucomicrobiota bacterium]